MRGNLDAITGLFKAHVPWLRPAPPARDLRKHCQPLRGAVRGGSNRLRTWRPEFCYKCRAATRPRRAEYVTGTQLGTQLAPNSAAPARHPTSASHSSEIRTGTAAWNGLKSTLGVESENGPASSPTACAPRKPAIAIGAPPKASPCLDETGFFAKTWRVLGIVASHVQSTSCP
jgi:hypothetical protein